MNEAGWMYVLISSSDLSCSNQFIVSQLPPAVKDYLLRQFTLNVPRRKKKNKTTMQAENKGSLT